MKGKPREISPALLDLARRAGDGDLSPWAHRRARENLAAALSRKTRPEPRWVLLVAATALCVALVVPAINMFHLRFSVSGGTAVTADGYVHAGEQSAAISFSDGTAIDIEPHSTLRIEHSGLRGADLVQEQGRATYAVVHRPAASWSVAAGPYRVRVTGTRFAVTWSPESGEMITELYEGGVTVEGPQAENGVVLHAGERFRASVGHDVLVESMRQSAAEEESIPFNNDAPAEANPTVDVTPVAPGDQIPSPMAEIETIPRVSPDKPMRGPAAPDEPRPERPKKEPTIHPEKQVPATETSARPSLSERLARGESRAIADEVEQEGVESFAARVSVSDLALIADAARYAQRSTLANSVLLLLRQRHPGTREAAVAAFHLGRAAEGANPARAMTWYDTYLTETSGAGAFAAEARGLKMLATRRSAGDAAAKPLAEAYLKLHPKGAHAQLARAILAVP